MKKHLSVPKAVTAIGLTDALVYMVYKFFIASGNSYMGIVKVIMLQLHGLLRKDMKGCKVKIV